MPVMGVETFERFFRVVADLDVDRNDLKRYSDFIHQKLYGLLTVGEAVAKANGRDIIQPRDLPLTKGLRSCIHEFRRADQEIELRPILEDLATRPLLDLRLSDETEASLPEIAGGLSVALGRSFRIVDPKLRNPQTAHWERAFGIFDLLL